MNTIWLERQADGAQAQAVEWGPEYYAWAPQYAFVLRRMQPKCMHEWGSGIWTAMALAAGARVITVEPDPQWARPYTGLPHQVILRMPESRIYVEIYPGMYDGYLVNGIRMPECLSEVLHTMDREAFVCVRRPYDKDVVEVLRLYPFVIVLGKHLAFAALSRMVFDRVAKKMDTTSI